MDVNVYEKKMSNLFATNRLLKFVVLATLVIAVSNHILLQKAINTQKTILVPAQLNTRVQILGDKASDEYVKMFAQVSAALAFTYTPQTVANNFGELLTMFAPEAYPQTKKTLTDLAETIATQAVSNVFYIQDIDVDSARNLFQVKGQQVRWIGGTRVENLPKNYEFSYLIKDGRFMLTSLSEVGVDASKGKIQTDLAADPKKSSILHSDAIEAATKEGAKK